MTKAIAVRRAEPLRKGFRKKSQWLVSVKITKSLNYYLFHRNSVLPGNITAQGAEFRAVPWIFRSAHGQW